MPSAARTAPAAFPRRVPLALGVLALAACADAPTAADDAPADAVIAADLAASTGEAVALDLVDLAAPDAAPAGGRTTTVARTVTFFDAAGAPMPAYDPALTASARHVVQVDGVRSGSGPGGTFVTAVHRRRARTVTGLAGAETRRTWNGTGVANDTTTHTGARGTRVYAKAVSDTAADVVVNLPRAANPWPASGQVVHAVRATLVVSGARAETRAVERRVVVTFNGTASVPITVGGVSCTLHLDTRRVEGCSR